MRGETNQTTSSSAKRAAHPFEYLFKYWEGERERERSELRVYAHISSSRRRRQRFLHMGPMFADASVLRCGGAFIFSPFQRIYKGTLITHYLFVLSSIHFSALRIQTKGSIPRGSLRALKRTVYTQTFIYMAFSGFRNHFKMNVNFCAR